MAYEKQNDEHLTLDEIVFENRNKEYGAYDLRFNYSKILTKSFIIGTVLFLVLALSPLIYATIQRLTAPPKVEVDAKLVDIIEDDPIVEQPKENEPPPPPPPKQEEPPKQEVIQNVVPEPVKAPKVETPPPPITKQLETTTGLVNQEGVKTPTYTPPPPPPSSGTGKVAVVEVKPQVTNEVYTVVDQEAEFAGGLNGFRSKFEQGFDNESMEGEGTVKTEVTFVVERDGSLTAVKASGSNSSFNKEAERTVKAIKGKWTPAKVNGQPVRSRFRFPVSMRFE